MGRGHLPRVSATNDSIRLAVSASAAGGYRTLRALDTRRGVLRETLAAREKSLKTAQRRFAAGYSSQLDLAQVEADHRAAAQLIPAAELAIPTAGRSWCPARPQSRQR